MKASQVGRENQQPYGRAIAWPIVACVSIHAQAAASVWNGPASECSAPARRLPLPRDATATRLCCRSRTRASASLERNGCVFGNGSFVGGATRVERVRIGSWPVDRESLRDCEWR